MLGLSEDQAAWRCEQSGTQLRSVHQLRNSFLEVASGGIMSLDRGARQSARRRPTGLGRGRPAAPAVSRPESPQPRSTAGSDSSHALVWTRRGGRHRRCCAGRPARNDQIVHLAVRELAHCTPWTTHGFGLVEALQLAETLGHLPRRVSIYTIEAQDVSPCTSSAKSSRGNWMPWWKMFSGIRPFGKDDRFEGLRPWFQL